MRTQEEEKSFAVGLTCAILDVEPAEAEEVLRSIHFCSARIPRANGRISTERCPTCGYCQTEHPEDLSSASARS